jgi:hypothetical protein
MNPASHAKEKWLARLRDGVRDGTLVKLTLSDPRGRDRTLRSVLVRPVVLQSGPVLSFVYRHATRDVTKNIESGEGLDLIGELAGAEFRRADLFLTTLTANLEFREGKGARMLERPPTHTARPSTQHDHARNHRIPPDRTPWLHALGVTTAEGRVAKGMEAKFRQINKFVEVLDHALGGIQTGPDQSHAGVAGPLLITDMGCGKGYLTFAACHELQRRGVPAHVRGIEARPDLVDLCNRAARDHHFAQLQFEAGTIANTALERTDVLIALHACDTATDDALAKGVAAGARLLLVAPCCHKEVRPQLQPPPVLAGALRHGILREREAEFVTDALRAALLEWAGYDTKVFEFVSTEHSAKNLMIAATKREGAAPTEAKARAVRELAAFYGVRTQHLAAALGFALEAKSQPPA